MHQLHTVYNELNASITHYKLSNYLIFTCLVFILIICFTYLIFKIYARNEIAKKKEEYKVTSLLVIFLEIVLFIVFLQIDKPKPNIYRSVKYLYDSSRLKQVKEVEGYVVDYCPMPQDGHGVEYFTVKGIDFVVPFYEVGRPGYHLPANHGGVIKPNLYVKIKYIYDFDRNAILELETE
jgi:hypothetical protein